jgi:hypothetical protein
MTPMQVSEDRFPTFAEFWPFYVSQHLDPVCRGLHFAGTGLALLCVALGLMASPRWLLLAPLVGYSFSWIGRFLFERNRPAAFGNPLLSLVADLRMFGLILGGRMGPHLERARRDVSL